MKEKIIILTLLIIIAIVMTGCSGAKAYLPPYSKAEIERQKIEDEQAIEQMKSINQESSVVGARIVTIRF